MTVLQIKRRAQWSGQHLKEARCLLGQCSALMERTGRTQLAAAFDELRRTLGTDIEAQVVVAGEFKAGKTSLFNALVDEPLLDVAPIDSGRAPVLARYGPARRFLGVTSESEVVELDPGEFRAQAAGRGGGPPYVQLIAELPRDFLQSGVVLIDTPSLSDGLASASGAVVLSYINACNALLLVTDASQELDAPQMAFLETVRDLGQPVMLTALTKIDLYPEWHRIKAVNEERLSALGATGPVVPVSPLLHFEGRLTGDDDAIVEGGVERLRWYLATTLLTDVAQDQTRAALVQADGLLTEAVASLGRSTSLKDRDAESSRLNRELHRLNEVQVALTNHGLSRRIRAALDVAYTNLVQQLEDDLKDERDRARRIIERDDPRYAWPAHRKEILRNTNTLYARHLGRLNEETTAAVRQTLIEAGVDPNDIPLARGDSPIPADPSIELAPDLDKKSGGGSATDVSRAVLTTSLSTFAGAGLLATLMPPLAPGAAVVALAAGAATLRSSLSKQREAGVSAGRASALQAVSEYFETFTRNLRHETARHRANTTAEIDEKVANEQHALLARTREEIGRLESERSLNDEQRRALRQQSGQAGDEIAGYRSAVSKLLHTLARPEMVSVRR